MNKGAPPKYTPNPPPGWTPAPVVIGTTVIQAAAVVGPEPTRVTCPSCRADVLTTLRHEATAKTHLIALCLFLFIRPPQQPPPAYTECSQPGYTPATYYQPRTQHVITQCDRPPPAAAVVIQTNGGNFIGNGPSRVICPHCRADILTNVNVQPSTATHLYAACLCLLGCWPCVCLPYCMDSCQNANHYCPNCNAYIGTYQS